MDKKIFLARLEPLGNFRYQHNGLRTDAYSDLEFQPKDTVEHCGDCLRKVNNRVVFFEKKWNAKGVGYWRRKCALCRETFVGLDL